MEYEVVPGPNCQKCGKEIQKPTDCDLELSRLGLYYHWACQPSEEEIREMFGK